jgi:hypothetical protein
MADLAMGLSLGVPGVMGIEVTWIAGMRGLRARDRVVEYRSGLGRGLEWRLEELGPFVMLSKGAGVQRV